MNTNLITVLRIAVSALAWVISFPPANANAYTSNGADGQFQPTVSMILDSTQQIFNFSSIFIPSGVTISFSGLASSQPIEFLATGNIDIAGTLDMGANSLWIETPGNIFLSGYLNSSGGALSLFSGGGRINLSGIINTLGGNPTLRDGGDNLAGGGNVITRGGGVLSPGGGTITITGGDVSLSPVPEPGVWVMLLLGLCALFAISQRRN